MTFDQIITLDHIVKQGSFKMASQVMHKSQPSLSMAIKKLEEEFGIKLFNREGYRPVLTEEGKSFYKKAQLTIEHFKALENLAIELGAGEESEINICVDAIFPFKEISTTLSDFFQLNTTTSLNLNIDVLEGVMSRLKNHEVDFAIGPDMNLGIEIESIHILETKLVPVIASKHFEESKGNINFLKSIPQIVVSSSSKPDNKSVSGAINNQFWYTTDLFTKEQLITSGLGWGRLPYHQVSQKIKNNDLSIIKGIPQISPKIASMYLLREKSKTMGPKAKKLWKQLSSIRDIL